MRVGFPVRVAVSIGESYAHKLAFGAQNLSHFQPIKSLRPGLSPPRLFLSFSARPPLVGCFRSPPIQGSPRPRPSPPAPPFAREKTRRRRYRMDDATALSLSLSRLRARVLTHSIGKCEVMVPLLLVRDAVSWSRGSL
ncbi:hypothetical protein DAI22_07g166701 [Oryza sativa Japonica Group]|nr:hypothetical protein DAI22_07g166701 [Oryza sativa Japonica Group]